MSTREDYAISLITVIALIGVLILSYGTKLGIGIGPDSVSYIEAARNLINGLGLNTLYGSNKPMPMTHFPPLFPVVLSTIGVFGVDPLHGARWFNALLFGSNILLAGLVIHNYTRSIWISTFGSFIMLTSVDMLKIHSWASTEPLFIFFTLLGFFLLAAYIENPKLSLFIASSSAIALGFLSRYVGAASVAAGIVGVFSLSKKAWRRRIGDAIAFAVVSALPATLWMIRNLYLAGTATNRKMVFHPPSFHYVVSSLTDTFSNWFLPARVPGIIREIFLRVVVVVLIVVSMLLLTRKGKPHKSDSAKKYFAGLPRLLAIFIFVYGAFLIVSASFFAATLEFNYRILSPVYVSGLIIVLCLAYKLVYSAKRTHGVKIASIIIGIFFAAFYLSSGAQWIMDTHGHGLGYAAEDWKQSDIIRKVKNLPSGIRIYSNGSDAIYILTGRSAFWIPSKADAGTLKINDSYLSEMATMTEDLENEGGVLVYLDRITWRGHYLPSEDELKKQLPLHLYMRGADGAIYEIAKSDNDSK